METIEFSEEVMRKAIDKWGEKSQLEMAQEEATELALAVRKYIRNNDDKSYSNMVGEIADVEIMIKQIKILYKELGIEKAIEFEKDSKIQRLNDRLNKNSFNG